MRLIADFHVHSYLSRATSRDMNLESLYRWSKIKGINIVGTGDFTHPAWFAEISSKLEPAQPGLFRLKDSIAKNEDKKLPSSVAGSDVRFILTAEISNIYTRANRVRKSHNLLICPSLAAASQLIARLSQVGNLNADGRPILGMDSASLLSLCLEVDSNILFIPAHVWTPWFSLFGSKSGFDSIEEAYGDLSCHLYALETGLSSDPPMNWRLSALDRFTLVSNSDAHSPSHLGREANIFDCDPNLPSIIQAIKNRSKGFIGTIEFFPQEGKYHFDGHAKCQARLSPEESLKYSDNCPVCGKKMTLGVDHRVQQLADRPTTFRPATAPSVNYIIPLVEILAEINGLKSVNSTKVDSQYHQIIAALGNEFDLLLNLDPKQVSEAGFPSLSQALTLLRRGQVYIQPGYDGLYGKIKLFDQPNPIAKLSGQISLF